MIRRPPRSTQSRSSAASDVYKRQRPIREESLEIVVVDLELLGHTGDANDDAEIASELEPRSDVPVVVERRHDDFVAFPQGSRECPREQEIERRHARPERDLSR